MALTRTSPLLTGSGESGVDLRSAARRPLPKVSRSLVIFAHDLAAALASLVLAILLLENGRLVLADARFLVHAVPLFLALASASFLAFGLHRGIWSYTSISDLGAIVKASTWVILLFVAIELVAEGTTAVPRAAWVIQWLVLVVLLCVTWLAYRFAKTAARRARAGALSPPATREVSVLLYGAGPLAALYVGAVRSTPRTNVRVVGIIEDAGTPRGRYVHDVPVLGSPHDLDRIVAELAVQGIHPERLVLTRTAERLPPEVRTFAERCRARHGVELHFLPDLLGVPADVSANDAASASSASDRAYFHVRRPVEVSLCALGLLVLMPLIVLIALLVLVDQGPPILFRQVRPGRGNRHVHALQISHHARSSRHPRRGRFGL